MTTDRKETDGTGAPIVDDHEYYVQDARGMVGNCGSWWGVKGNGYYCNLREAGLYTGERVRSMRDTDVPWPKAHVEAQIVWHVRTDTAAFHRRDDAYERQRSEDRAEAEREKAYLRRHGVNDGDDVTEDE